MKAPKEIASKAERYKELKKEIDKLYEELEEFVGGGAMKYKCKKSFCVDRYDEDGFLIENSSIVIDEGKAYELDESGHMMIGGQDHVHIDAVDYGSWLEITKKHFEEYFELLKVE